MTPEQALRYLADMAAAAPAPKMAHVQAEQAAAVLAQLIKASAESEKEKE